MSRLGKAPIQLPNGTQTRLEEDFVIVKGPKGELREKIAGAVKLEIGEKEVKISVQNPKIKREKALWGLYASLIKNMIRGVNEGFERKLEINGVGYRAAANGNKVTLNVGFSHPVEYNLPEGINAKVEGNVITIGGINKQMVGEVAAQIRKIRRPEPYKGKGIKYAGEIIRKKAGKTAAKGS